MAGSILISIAWALRPAAAACSALAACAAAARATLAAWAAAAAPRATSAAWAAAAAPRATLAAWAAAAAARITRAACPGTRVGCNQRQHRGVKATLSPMQAQMHAHGDQSSLLQVLISMLVCQAVVLPVSAIMTVGNMHACLDQVVSLQLCTLPARPYWHQHAAQGICCQAGRDVRMEACATKQQTQVRWHSHAELSSCNATVMLSCLAAMPQSC
jgi:hypothetical protein